MALLTFRNRGRLVSSERGYYDSKHSPDPLRPIQWQLLALPRIITWLRLSGYQPVVTRITSKGS